MAASIIDLCDAVAATLGSTVYPFTFDITRTTLPEVDLAATASTTAYVYPMTSTLEDFTREEWHRMSTVMIHIVNYINGDTVEEIKGEIDDSIFLREQIEESFLGQSYPELGQMFRGFEQNEIPLFDLGNVDQKNQIHIQIMLKYTRIV